MALNRYLALLSLPIILTTLMYHENASARLTKRGDRYHFYVGLGAGFGGFQSSTSFVAVNEIGKTGISNITGHVNNINLNSGFTVNGLAGGLTSAIGFELRTKEGIYFASEVYFAALFKGDRTTSREKAMITNSSSEATNYIFGIENLYYITSNGQRFPEGTNGFANIMANFKLGWAPDSRLAIYAIIGVGYQFMSGTLAIQQGSNAQNPIPLEIRESGARISLDGFTVQYGLGISYYFAQNFGFALQGIATAPIHQMYNVLAVANYTDKTVNIWNLQQETTATSYIFSLSILTRI